jgi:siroheme synthase (precorrin-2 oxidase/ferrochelatase)
MQLKSIYYPLLTYLKRNVLVIGGNSDAAHQVSALVQAGATVTLIAKKDALSKSLQAKVSSGEFAWFNRTPLPRDIEGKDFVVSFSKNDNLANACLLKNVLYIDSESSIKIAKRYNVVSDFLVSR